MYEDNYRCYGVGKMYHQLRRDGHQVARCTVRRLMRELGIQGLVRGKTVCTTVADQQPQQPEDLVSRDFHAPALLPSIYTQYLVRTGRRLTRGHADSAAA